MKKKLALDLDGVVFDSENLYRIYTEIYDRDIKRTDNIINNSKRMFQERYNWSKSECDEFYQKYSKIVLMEASLMTGAKMVIEKLIKHFEIIIVTARNDDELRYALKKLKDVNLDNVTIYNNEHHKIDKYVLEKVDYIIDDDENICLTASKQNICALYFKNNASEKVEENIYLKNVNNWGEIYKFLMLKENI